MAQRVHALGHRAYRQHGTRGRTDGWTRANQKSMVQMDVRDETTMHMYILREGDWRQESGYDNGMHMGGRPKVLRFGGRDGRVRKRKWIWISIQSKKTSAKKRGRKDKKVRKERQARWASVSRVGYQ